MNASPHQHPALTVLVETRILGSNAESIAVPLPARRLRVVDLIRARAEAEWALHERGEREVVGRESLAPEGLSPGTWRPSGAGAAVPAPATFDEALRAALDGYRAGWYIILVNGEEPGGLDAWLALDDASAVAFVRVYPLPDARRVDRGNPEGSGGEMR